MYFDKYTKSANAQKSKEANIKFERLERIAVEHLEKELNSFSNQERVRV